MKIPSSLTLLFIIVFNFNAPAQVKANAGNSLLWQISGKNLTHPSYIFGTIHIICKTDYLWTAAMKRSLEHSDKVCFEMDLDNPSVMMDIATALIDQNGKTLKNYFSPDEYHMLKQYLKDSLNIDISLFSKMKPVALQTIISAANPSCGEQVSYEDSIMKLAHKDSKEVIGLEEPKEQIAALETIPTDSVIKELLTVVKNRKSQDSEYNQMLQAYKRQDIATLYTIVADSKESGTNMAVFLDERNIKWIPRIKNMMRQSSVFFAVGAGHLWGDNGVISLLRKDGYTVTPIK